MCIACGRPRCKTCAHIKIGVRFSSTATGEDFRAWATANCKTSNRIYLIECQKCGKQCVGETKNPFHLRLKSHRSDYIVRLADKPVGKRFNESGSTFGDLTIMVIKKLGTASGTRRKNWESFWIHTLRSLTPDRLNLQERSYYPRK